MKRPGFWGEGNPEPSDLPGKFPALLGFHGFGGTPRELDLIASVAQARGLRVRLPLLPGHGTHPNDLQSKRFSDWYEHGEQQLLSLTEGGKVILCGLSTGALIAMKLAATHPSVVTALIVLANAVALTAPYPAWPLSVLHRMKAPDFLLPKRSGPDIHDPQARARHLTYDAQPVQAAGDLQQAGQRLLPLLSRIHCPTFIAHGRDDHVCPVANAWRVADLVGTNDVEVLILERSWHVVTKDYDAQQLMDRVGTFLDRVA